MCDAAGGKRLLWTLDTSNQQLCPLADNIVVHTTLGTQFSLSQLVKHDL